jgi:hypothetical protein
MYSHDYSSALPHSSPYVHERMNHPITLEGQAQAPIISLPCGLVGCFHHGEGKLDWLAALLSHIYPYCNDNSAIKGYDCYQIIRVAGERIYSQMSPIFHISRPKEPLPNIIVHTTHNPDPHQDGSLDGSKDGPSHHNKPTDDGEDDRNKDERLDRTMQFRLSKSQNDGAQYSKKEEKVLRKSIKREQDAHVPEEDIDGR